MKYERRPVLQQALGTTLIQPEDVRRPHIAWPRFGQVEDRSPADGGQARSDALFGDFEGCENLRDTVPVVNCKIWQFNHGKWILAERSCPPQNG